jgi:hypothetical protein
VKCVMYCSCDGVGVRANLVGFELNVMFGVVGWS